jgi:uncharacterized protein YdeI (YjbR/CyaY-like superfamily)
MTKRKDLRAGANAAAGDAVTGVLKRDTTERIVDVPPELVAALAKAKKARAAFDAMAYSHRKEYAQWVGSAKKSETRVARALKTVEKLSA